MASSKIYIKSTGLTQLAEAEAMRFVSQNTSIPVPAVYHAFERKGRVYIVNQRIKAPSLSDWWVQRSNTSKEKIMQQLSSMVRELRGLQAPAGTDVSNVKGGPIMEFRLPRYSRWGPFTSIGVFHKALVDDQELSAVTGSAFATYRICPHSTTIHGLSRFLLMGTSVVSTSSVRVIKWMIFSTGRRLAGCLPTGNTLLHEM